MPGSTAGGGLAGRRHAGPGRRRLSMRAWAMGEAEPANWTKEAVDDSAHGDEQGADAVGGGRGRGRRLPSRTKQGGTTVSLIG